MKGKTGFVAIGVVAGFVAAAILLRLRQAHANDPEALSEQVSENLKELESRLSGRSGFGLVEQRA